jgi:hypothetical protein
MAETAALNAGPPTSSAVREHSPRRGILIGHARCSTEKQDLTAQCRILGELGVAEDRIYLDHGLTGRNRSRPGLNNGLAALREGDTLVVPKLDRLARSVPDARAIGDSLAARDVRLSLGGSVYDPNDPMGKCFFNILATFANLRSICCGCARAKGWRSPSQETAQGQDPEAQSHSARGPSQAPPGPVITRSPSLPNCSRSAAPPCTARSREQTARPDLRDDGFRVRSAMGIATRTTIRAMRVRLRAGGRPQLPIEQGSLQPRSSGQPGFG